MKASRTVGFLATAVLIATGWAKADVFNMGGTRNAGGSWTGLASLEMVGVGNPGNAGELSGDGVLRPARICGAVDYPYRIGKFEVTAGQYTEFLNAVAKTDTYGLYNTLMSSSLGCRIERTGSSGSYTYAVPADWANRPVNCVSWGDAARFCNWLTNGQPTGSQDLATTENGSYYLNGATTDAELLAVTRTANARYVIPTEDEWYKAAYYDANKPGGAGYWEYPTGTDSLPSNDLVDPDPGNNANFYQSGYTISGPYYRTEVGEFENSASPCGTFDQAGNVWEWNEATMGSYRGLRSGSFYDDGLGELGLQAWHRDSYYPTTEVGTVGFRVAEVPDPPTLGLLALGGLAVLRRRRK